MAKRVFECEVTRVDTYKIEIDDEVINDEWMDGFSHVFFDCRTLEGHAEHIAMMRARNSSDFIEGYGYVHQNGQPPISCLFHENNKSNPAINIEIIDEDNDCEVEVKEIE